MTPKDLRDIAAYYGVSFTIDYSSDLGSARHILDYEGLQRIVTAEVNVEVLLELRPISSLTDEELVRCMEILHPNGSAFKHEKGAIRLGDFTLINSTAEVYSKHGFSVPTSKLYTYLQFIGVYVPGSIDEKYVQLMET